MYIDLTPFPPNLFRHVDYRPGWDHTQNEGGGLHGYRTDHFLKKYDKNVNAIFKSSSSVKSPDGWMYAVPQNSI